MNVALVGFSTSWLYITAARAFCSCSSASLCHLSIWCVASIVSFSSWAFFTSSGVSFYCWPDWVNTLFLEKLRWGFNVWCIVCSLIVSKSLDPSTKEPKLPLSTICWSFLAVPFAFATDFCDLLSLHDLLVLVLFSFDGIFSSRLGSVSWICYIHL